MQYNTNLTEVIATAPVNQTAVLETGSYPADTPTTAIPLLTGRLLNSAGVKNCMVSEVEVATVHQACSNCVIACCCFLKTWPTLNDVFNRQPACSALQGKYAELPSQQVTRDLATNSVGGFSVADPVAASYNFKKSYQNSACVDALTSKLLRMPVISQSPADAAAVNTRWP
jgi:hypothetical protein